VSEAEDRRADQLLGDAEDHAAFELREQHDDEQRHEEDARDGERVRKVHERRVRT
jgi:hypothetical protein